ncbi:MAG: hypothetical protein HOO93_13300, partial [Methyloglobulus sp.]|nr:hypothetical protein [Methyloglobulus sp.]
MFGFKIGDANSVAFYSDNQEKLKHVKSATLVEQAAALCRAKFGLKKERDAYAQQEGNIRHIQGCIAYLDKQIFGYRAAIAKAPAAIAFGQFSETQLSAVNKSLDDDLAERERLLQSLKINQDALPHVNTAVGFKSSLKTGVEVEIVNSLADRAMDTIRTKAGPDLVLLVQAVCAKTWQPGARESFESVFLRLIDPLFPNSKTPGNGIMLPNYAEGMEAITTLLDEAAMTAKPTRVVKKHGGKEFFCLE